MPYAVGDTECSKFMRSKRSTIVGNYLFWISEELENLS